MLPRTTMIGVESWWAAASAAAALILSLSDELRYVEHLSVADPAELQAPVEAIMTTATATAADSD
jgi:hypothetical protein